MQFEDLLTLVGTEPLFSSALLRVAGIPSGSMRVQIVRWVKTGKLIRLRRGLYVLGPAYRKVEPHPFLLANRIKKASYVSLQSALAHYDMIPEHVPAVTSVTAGRPEEMKTPIGLFLYKHVKKNLLGGFRNVEVAPGQFVLIASPEKALLDLIYLTPEADRLDYLLELRLQNLGVLNRDALVDSDRLFASPKIHRAADIILRLVASQREATS
jgi:hypothetical protein